MAKYKQLFLEVLGFVLLASIMGLAAQTVLPNGISPITDITLVETADGTVNVPSVAINPDGQSIDSRPISLDSAFTAFTAGSAIFLDARELEAYESGRIAGAVHLTVEAFMDSLDFLDTLPMDQMIVTYCDGEDCNASIDLAAELVVMGFENVYFFFGGWQEWTLAEYPIEGVSGE